MNSNHRYYIVELRCATCGIIFCNSSGVVPQHQVQEYVDMFTTKGPDKFVQCKNRCPRNKAGEPPLIESKFHPPKNMNQVVIVTPVPDAELRGQGLMA